MPSQGRNTSDCGVFMLGFISAYVNNIQMKFGVRDMPFLRSSFAKIIINGRPWHDCSNKFPDNHDSFHSVDGEPGHMYQEMRTMVQVQVILEARNAEKG